MTTDLGTQIDIFNMIKNMPEQKYQLVLSSIIDDINSLDIDSIVEENLAKHQIILRSPALYSPYRLWIERICCDVSKHIGSKILNTNSIMEKYD